MEFLTQDDITALGLTPDQITGITPKFEGFIATQKQQWDGKANENAEKILAGAASYVQSKLGVTEERQQGEKYGDYLARLADKSIEAKQSEVTRLKGEYDQKLKDFKGDDATKAELQEAKTALDEAKKLLADYDTIKSKAELYDKTSEELNGFKLEVAFSNVKPNFPETANPYEVRAKWENFKKGVLEKNTIELVEGEPMAIEKENKYKQTKLSDLVKADAELSALVAGRQQDGTGARVDNTGKVLKIEGLPFDVTETAKTDTKERQKLIQEALTKEGIGATHKDYSKKFADYNSKIISAK